MKSRSSASSTLLKEQRGRSRTIRRQKKMPKLVTKAASISPESSSKARKRSEAIASSEFRREIIQQFEFCGKRTSFNSIVSKLFDGQLIAEQKPICGILKTPSSERKRSKSLKSKRRVSIQLSKNQVFPIPCNERKELPGIPSAADSPSLQFEKKRSKKIGSL